jgi:hypothetical protein
VFKTFFFYSMPKLERQSYQQCRFQHGALKIVLATQLVDRPNADKIEQESAFISFPASARLSLCFSRATKIHAGNLQIRIEQVNGKGRLLRNANRDLN